MRPDQRAAPRIYLGSSSWNCDDWKEVFYPAAVADPLAYYARRFDTVEVDSTWYGTPARHTVESWRKRVPAGFRFALKVPRTVTHDRALHACEGELNTFLSTVSHLDDRLGPILFQFPPHFGPAELPALRTVLKLLPRGWKFAMEFRNRAWFQAEHADLLRSHEVAWTLADFGNLLTSAAPLPIYTTAAFTYVRWLGDRHEPLAPLNSLKKDRSTEEERWAELLQSLPVDEAWGYFNNHWAGFSPGSVDAFKKRLGLPVKPGPEPSEQGTLF